MTRRVHRGYAIGGHRRQVEERRVPHTVVRSATDGRDMLINRPDGWEVSAPWLWWAGGGGEIPEEGIGPGGGPLGNPPPGANMPGKLPAAVTRCTSLICDTIAGMPWQVRRGRERLETPAWIADPQMKRRDERVYGGPLPEWRRTAMEFRIALLKAALWTGEGIIYVPNRNDDDSPAPPLWQLNRWMIEEEGGRYYVAGGQLNPVTGRYEDDYEFAPGELIMIRGQVFDDDPRGYGVLQAHFFELGLAGLIGDYATAMLQRGPSGYLKVTAPQLTGPKAKELQNDWDRAHGGITRRTAVLNATTEFHKLQLDPVALELAKMRDYSTLDIALIFGVPPYMLGLVQASDTYANVESRMIELARFTLLPWSRRAEDAYDAELPRGTDMKVNMDSLLRGDTLARYQAYKLGVDGDWLTEDEIRALEDRPPMEAQREVEAIAARRGLRVVDATGGGPQ
jgi:HK97 family phage portal protein